MTTKALQAAAVKTRTTKITSSINERIKRFLFLNAKQLYIQFCLFVCLRVCLFLPNFCPKSKVRMLYCGGGHRGGYAHQSADMIQISEGRAELFHPQDFLLSPPQKKKKKKKKK